MTVLELIEKLRSMPQNASVGFDEEQDGEEVWTNITKVELQGKNVGFQVVSLE